MEMAAVVAGRDSRLEFPAVQKMAAGKVRAE